MTQKVQWQGLKARLVPFESPHNLMPLEETSSATVISLYIPLYVLPIYNKKNPAIDIQEYSVLHTVSPNSLERPLIIGHLIIPY